MADRILAAMDYLDAHTKVIPLKLKQRALGDIDGKYSVVDPLLEISYCPVIKNDVPLSGVRKTNPSNDRPPEEIVEEDRGRMVQSADSARSAPAPFKDTLMTSSTRPMTSSSWVTGGSLGTRDVDRHLQHSAMTSASRASIKRLTFTSPTVKVGPADVRDELMDEIVNKPLVFHRNNLKSQSAPPSGRTTSSALKSTGTRSVRWVVAPKRAKTSFHRRRRGAKSWEKNPGPFMTVKVTGKDLWVVSNSTPTSYFTDKEDDGLRETSGMNGTRASKWQDTAESVPKPEQLSPPRHERLLGASAQFAPSIQWLRYDHSSPPKKPPVLTPFKDGRYYNVESAQSKTVSQHLDASPGVRIARNGAVLAHSMKLGSLDASEAESRKDSEGDGSDIDVASLIPAKLAPEVRKHYGTPENETEEEDRDDGQEEEEEIEDRERQEEIFELQNAFEKEEESDTELLQNGVRSPQKLEKDADQEKDSGHDSEEASELSSMSGDDAKDAVEKKPYQDPKLKRTLLTRDSLALLTKLAGHDLSNPIVDDSAGSATSFEESLESYELNNFLEQNGINVDSPRIANGHSEQDDVWRILENVTPNFWITKSKHQKLAILKRLRRQRKSQQIASARKSLNSSKTKNEINEVILPLCWEDEINKANSKIVHVRPGVPAQTQQSPNTSLPVVFHKVLRYDKLPAATVNFPLKPATSMAKHRPRPTTSKSVEGMTFGFDPNRSYRAPVSTPRSNRSMRTKSASASSTASASSVYGHSAPHFNGTDIIRRSIDLADLLCVTLDSFPAKTQQVTTRVHTVKKEHVTIVHDNISETDMQSVRKVASQNMNKHGEDANSSKPKTASAPGNRVASGLTENKERVSAPVGTLNLAGIDLDTTKNDTVMFSSQRPSEVRSTSFTTPHHTHKTPILRHSVPLTPKTSARGQHLEFIRLGVEADEDVVRNGDGAHEMPLSSKLITGSTARTPLSARTRGGINSVSLTQNRLKSGSSRGAPAHHGVTGPRPMRALPNLQPTMANGATDLSLSAVSMQLSAQALHNGLSPKTADFIQITQSLHISDRSPANGDNSTVTGNKMYDSYMHELAAHGGEGEVDERNDPGGIVGLGLGGTSGKSSVFSLHRSVKKGPSSYRQSQQNLSMSPSTPQAARRSGLTMIPHDNNQKVGPFGLGVKGDQVRLNIDKNIHNIYRDLGLFKASGMPSKVDQHEGSPGRSHVSSVGSRTASKEESAINIPTASEPSAIKILQQLPKQAPLEVSQPLQEVKTKRPSPSNPATSVQDSGSQWSGRTVKFGDSRGLETHPGQPNVNGHSDTAISSGQVEVGTKEDNNPRIKFRGVSPGGSTAQALTIERTHLTDNIHSPTSERPLARAIARSSDAISATECNLSLGSQLPSAAPRSASEVSPDRLAEMGSREESSAAAEEEVEETEDTAVKGVTRVIVNMPVKTEAIS